MNRFQALTAHIDKSMAGLEIGPSHNPIAPKKDGWNVEIVDHASAEELKAKYAQHSDTIASLDNIEEVNYVWHGGSLVDLVGKPGHYDYIIASHVLEHTTDLITFLQACEQLLKPTGKLLLALPDKRYCFDYFRPYSTTGDVLQAYHEQRSRHTPGKLFDMQSNAVLRGKDISWSRGDARTLKFCVPMGVTREQWEQSLSNPEYVDIHNWMFTPASFRLIIADLQKLGLLRLSYSSSSPVRGFEFFVVLSASEPLIATPRIELCQDLMRDIREWSGRPSVLRIGIGTIKNIARKILHTNPKLEQRIKKLLK